MKELSSIPVKISILPYGDAFIWKVRPLGSNKALITGIKSTKMSAYDEAIKAIERHGLKLTQNGST